MKHGLRIKIKWTWLISRHSASPVISFIWDPTQENVTVLHANNKGADRPASASAQSGQRVCYSLFRKYICPNLPHAKFQYFTRVFVDEQACLSLTGGSDTEETFSRDYVRSGPASRKRLAALMPYEKAMMSFQPNIVASHLCLGFLLSDWFNVI